jgi:hypothetical protein
MTTAYDLKDLGESFKAEGLTVLEKETRAAFVIMTTWLKKSATLSATPWDDLAFQFLSQYEALVLAKIDEIDGKKA